MHFGRIRIVDDRWIQSTHPLQELHEQAYDLALVPENTEPTFSDLPILILMRNPEDPLDLHDAIAHAAREVCLTPFSIHHLDHWSHIPRVNQLAIPRRWKRLDTDGNEQVFWGKFVLSLFLWKIRVFSCDHSSRLVLLVKLQDPSDSCCGGMHHRDNVEIGPHAVVRACVVGDGAKIDEHCVVNLSVVGKARVEERPFAIEHPIPNVMFSHGDGSKALFLVLHLFRNRRCGIGYLVWKRDSGTDGDWVSSGMHFWA